MFSHKIMDTGIHTLTFNMLPVIATVTLDAIVLSCLVIDSASVGTPPPGVGIFLG